MISTDVLVGIEFLAFFGGLLWFGWRQAKMMERAVAEDKRKAAESARRDGGSADGGRAGA